MCAEGRGGGSEIWVRQLRAGHSLGVVVELVGADGAELRVAHDHHQKGPAGLYRGGKFLPVHQIFAVASDGDDGAFREL